MRLRVCGVYLDCSLDLTVEKKSSIFRILRRALASPFEILHCAFMFLSGGARVECAKVSTFACLGIFLSGVEAVFS